MHPLQMPARQMNWAARSIAHNLDYIADDKLRWKPAATAPSALEIVDHLLGVLHRMTPLVGGFESADEAPQPVENRDDAKTRLIEAAAKYSAMSLDLTPQQLDETVETRAGNMPRSALALMPINDIAHHHGQIAYIQLMLGDTETHRDLAALLKDE